MLAIIVTPGAPGRERLGQLEESEGSGDQLLVRTLALGVCGTDREIFDGRYGWAPPGRDWLVLGHESVGRVTTAPPGGGFAAGDLVVGIVRRPDPEPCACCAEGEFDMCRNGGYRERGIKELDGYGAELVTLEPEFAIKLDPSLGLLGVLTEPTSVVAKAWEQIDGIRYQACRPLASALITGAGPIGLLAALLGVQRGLDVHILDLVREGTKPELARLLGASYHTGTVADACRSAEPDVVLECTGVPELVVEAVQSTAPAAVACLLGVSRRGRALNIDVGALNNELVLKNDVVFGSVNANHRHFAAAANALAAADPEWLARLITRRVPPNGRRLSRGVSRTSRRSSNSLTTRKGRRAGRCNETGDAMRVGIVGLGRMGIRLAQAAIEHGHGVVGYDPGASAAKALVDEGLVLAASLEDLIDKLPSPRIVLIYVPHGDPTERVCEQLRALASGGDVVVDGGNSHWEDSRRRHCEFAREGIRFLDVGTSGGLWGARYGACFMAGGDSEGYALIEPLLRDLAFDERATLYVGPPGSGHFVKLIHNAIEFGMVQSIAEGAELLMHSEFELDLPAVFANWNHGSVIRSWLVELMSEGLRENPDLSRLSTYVEDTGEVKWVLCWALERDIPSPVVSESQQALMSYRDLDAPAAKAVALLRHGFGGHPVHERTEQLARS